MCENHSQGARLGIMTVTADVQMVPYCSNKITHSLHGCEECGKGYRELATDISPSCVDTWASTYMSPWTYLICFSTHLVTFVIEMEGYYSS